MRSRYPKAAEVGIRRGYLRRLTVIVNLAVCVFALVSVAEQVTTVRPILNRLPDARRHEARTAPSTSSRADTVYVTHTRFARRGARTVLLTVPLSAGGVTSSRTLRIVNVACNRPLIAT